MKIGVSKRMTFGGENASSSLPKSSGEKENVPVTGSGGGTTPSNFGKIIVVFLSSFAYVVVPVLVANLLNGGQTEVSNELPVGLLIFVGLYSLSLLVFIAKMGEWAAKYPAVKGVAPVDVSSLKNAILSLPNNLPVQVESVGEMGLKIRWNYVDKNFAYLFGLGKIKEGYELLLKFDPKKNTVFTGEILTSLKADAGGILKPSMSFKYKYFKGISLFQYDYGSKYGFKVVDGKLVFDQLYKYTFNPGEIKGPIINLVINSGWNYSPKVFLK